MLHRSGSQLPSPARWILACWRDDDILVAGCALGQLSCAVASVLRCALGSVVGTRLPTCDFSMQRGISLTSFVR